jgi:hypothetical protein
MIDNIDYRKILDWINAVWAKSLVAVLLFVIGLWIGSVQTEIRVIGDCKYAGAFRVNHEAFVCQRRI